MPVFLLIVATFLIAAGINDKTGELTGLLKGDFASSNGKPGFATWIFAIFAIGALGYIKPLKPVSVAFLTLIVVVLFLSNGTGFFAKITGLLHGQGLNKLNTPPDPFSAGGGSFSGAGASGSF